MARKMNKTQTKRALRYCRIKTIKLWEQGHLSTQSMMKAQDIFDKALKKVS